MIRLCARAQVALSASHIIAAEIPRNHNSRDIAALVRLSRDERAQ